MRLFLLAIALVLVAPPVSAQDAEANIDYAAFQALTQDVEPYRQSRLLGWDAFARKAKEPGVLLLDARSADAFAAVPRRRTCR